MLYDIWYDKVTIDIIIIKRCYQTNEIWFQHNQEMKLKSEHSRFKPGQRADTQNVADKPGFKSFDILLVYHHDVCSSCKILDLASW